MTRSTHSLRTAKKPAATDVRSFRTFLLVQQFQAAEIGARIAQARMEAGRMTQEQLGELINVSTRSIQDYEGGATIPWKHFASLAAIFKKPVEWFLHGEGEEIPELSAVGDLARQVASLARDSQQNGELLRELAQLLRDAKEPPQAGHG